jgi:hypothetical protein
MSPPRPKTIAEACDGDFNRLALQWATLEFEKRDLQRLIEEKAERQRELEQRIRDLQGTVRVAGGLPFSSPPGVAPSSPTFDTSDAKGETP